MSDAKTPRSREELETWARELSRLGDPSPLEFLARFRQLEITAVRARRLVALSDRPGWREQEPRIDHLRERLGERAEILRRKLARTMRAAWGVIPVHPIFLFIVTDVWRSAESDRAQSELKSESLRRRLARSRRLRARALPLPMSTSGPSPLLTPEPGIHLTAEMRRIAQAEADRIASAVRQGVMSVDEAAAIFSPRVKRP